MKSITIHNMEPDLAAAIEESAEKSGMSKNKLIKEKLRESFGLIKKRIDISAFVGVWTEEEAKEFRESIADFKTIDPKDWE